MVTPIAMVVHNFAASLPTGSRLLDVGCGLKPYAFMFTQSEYIGIDVEVSGRKYSQKAADIVFDGVHIPAQQESFDAILCTEVLEHSLDPIALVAEMFRVLKKGGKLCITVPFIWGLHELPYDFRRFTPNGLARLIEGAGFSVDFQDKLMPGVDAIRALVNSEINNYRVNVLPLGGDSSTEPLHFRVALLLHNILFRLLYLIWRSSFRFERIFIDNHLLAHKPEEVRQDAAIQIKAVQS